MYIYIYKFFSPHSVQHSVFNVWRCLMDSILALKSVCAQYFHLEQIFGKSSVTYFGILAESTRNKKKYGKAWSCMAVSVRIQTDVGNIGEDRAPKRKMSEWTLPGRLDGWWYGLLKNVRKENLYYSDLSIINTWKQSPLLQILEAEVNRRI
jgi:hypothetical protein